MPHACEKAVDALIEGVGVRIAERPLARMRTAPGAGLAPHPGTYWAARIAAPASMAGAGVFMAVATGLSRKRIRPVMT